MKNRLGNSNASVSRSSHSQTRREKVGYPIKEKKRRKETLRGREQCPGQGGTGSRQQCRAARRRQASWRSSALRSAPGPVAANTLLGLVLILVLVLILALYLLVGLLVGLYLVVLSVAVCQDHF